VGATGKFGYVVDLITGKAVQSAKNLTKAINKQEAASKSASGGIKSLAKSVLALGAGYLTVRTAASLFIGGALKQQAALKDTMTLIGATGAEFDDLESGMSKRSRELSVMLNKDASEINKGFYQVLSTGAKAGTQDFDKFSTTALKMAKTVNLDASFAIERLNDTINAFGMNLGDAEYVTERLFKTSILAATTVPQLTEAMRDAGPAAAGLGLKLEETLTILAAFAQGGIKGAQAGTAFRMVLTKLAAPTGDAKKWLDKLGVSFYDLETGKIKPFISVLKDLKQGLAEATDKERAMAVKAIAGERAIAKLLSLLGKDLDVLEDWNEGLEKTAGSFDHAFGVKMSADIERLGQFTQAIKNLAAVLGGEFLSATVGALVKFGEFVKIVYEVDRWFYTGKAGPEPGRIGQALKEAEDAKKLLEALKMRQKEAEEHPVLGFIASGGVSDWSGRIAAQEATTEAAYDKLFDVEQKFYTRRKLEREKQAREKKEEVTPFGIGTISDDDAGLKKQLERAAKIRAMLRAGALGQFQYETSLSDQQTGYALSNLDSVFQKERKGISDIDRLLELRNVQSLGQLHYDIGLEDEKTNLKIDNIGKVFKGEQDALSYLSTIRLELDTQHNEQKKIWTEEEQQLKLQRINAFAEYTASMMEYPARAFGNALASSLVDGEKDFKEMWKSALKGAIAMTAQMTTMLILAIAIKAAIGAFSGGATTAGGFGMTLVKMMAGGFMHSGGQPKRAHSGYTREDEYHMIVQKPERLIRGPAVNRYTEPHIDYMNRHKRPMPTGGGQSVHINIEHISLGGEGDPYQQGQRLAAGIKDEFMRASMNGEKIIHMNGVANG